MYRQQNYLHHNPINFRKVTQSLLNPINYYSTETIQPHITHTSHKATSQIRRRDVQLALQIDDMPTKQRILLQLNVSHECPTRLLYLTGKLRMVECKSNYLSDMK